jgi:gas vesicle protein
MYYSQEAEQRAQRDRLSLALVATAIGIGMGAVIALIFAQQSGDEVRRQLGEQFENAVNQGAEVAGKAVKEAKKTADKVIGEVEDRLQNNRS